MTVWEKLATPFPESAIEWRVGRMGWSSTGPWLFALAYITSRHVMQRLDETVGPENWRASFREVSGGFLCRLEIRVNDEWLVREDGADKTDVEAIKGGVSDSLKRAAVHYGIGRYLYDLTESFADVAETKQKGWRYHKDAKTGKEVWWQPPRLPREFLPPMAKQPKAEEPPETQRVEAKPAEQPLPPDVAELQREISSICGKSKDDWNRMLIFLSDGTISMQTWADERLKPGVAARLLDNLRINLELTEKPSLLVKARFYKPPQGE